jgi:hypothetical protein
MRVKQEKFPGRNHLEGRARGGLACGSAGQHGRPIRCAWARRERAYVGHLGHKAIKVRDDKVPHLS